MQFKEINVIQLESGSWCVDQGKPGTSKRFFKTRACAVAYARAVACSSGADMYIAGPNGAKCRQSRESLTYPVALE